MKTVDPLYGIAAFLAVAGHESFTAAAETLGLSRATVSAQVADLEQRLGVRLFHRSTRLVRLTPAGRVYREQLADLNQRVDLAERAARAAGFLPAFPYPLGGRVPCGTPRHADRVGPFE